MLNIKKQYTVIPGTSDCRYYIVSKYINGNYVDKTFVDYEYIHETMNWLEQEGYIFAEDTKYLQNKINELQQQIDIIQEKIDKAIASKNYIGED